MNPRPPSPPWPRRRQAASPRSSSCPSRVPTPRLALLRRRLRGAPDGREAMDADVSAASEDRVGRVHDLQELAPNPHRCRSGEDPRRHQGRANIVDIRGLFPLLLSPAHRFPFYDGVFDLVHVGATALDEAGAPAMGQAGTSEALEFFMFDVDRVLRVDGLLWIDSYLCQSEEKRRVVVKLTERFGYKKLKRFGYSPRCCRSRQGAEIVWKDDLIKRISLIGGNFNR